MKKNIIAPQASKSNQVVQLDSETHMQSQETNPVHERRLRKAELRGKYNTLSDQIAEDTTYFGNYKYPNCWKLFPEDSLMHTVSKYYPNAKKGPLLVDEPVTEKQMLRAYEKHRILKLHGMRHIVIEKDSTLENILEQLGEF